MSNTHPHILLIEDDQTTRTALEDILSREGYRVTTFAQGGELEFDGGNPSWDLALLDFHLPGENGLSIAQRMMKQTQGEMPIILLSSDDESSGIFETALESGVRACLAKPFEKEDLLVIMREILHSSPETWGV
jgi:DNA-binding response OmpR family regulator